MIAVVDISNFCPKERMKKVSSYVPAQMADEV